jgi:hypothetical protein
MKMNAKVREFIPRDRCYDFLNIFAEKCSEKNGVFAQTTASFCKNYDNYIGFWEKRHFFQRKLGKIAENCDHKIDPWSQSHDHQLQRQRCKNLQRHVMRSAFWKNKNIFIYFQKTL